MSNRSNLSIENKILEASRAVEPRREFSDALWNEIASTPQNTSARYSSPRLFFSRAGWMATASLIVVVVFIFAIGPQKVMAFCRNLFLGYLPGIGFVQNDGTTMYLENPVSVEKDGITLTVSQAISDVNNTVIAYQIDNLPKVGPDEIVTCFYDVNLLRLPDGTIKRPIGGGSAGSQARIEYPSLPAGVNQATLLVSMDNPDPACVAPAEWEIDLPFVPLPPDATLMPVFENQETPAPAADETAAVEPQASEGAPESMNENKVTAVIDRTVVLEDGFLVTGHFQWENKNWQSVSVIYEAIEAFDSTGKQIPLEFTLEGDKDNNFSFVVKGTDFQKPLIIKFNSVMVNAQPDDNTIFSFDAGPNPQIGQTWEINQTLDVSGEKVTIKNVKAIYESESPILDQPVETAAPSTNTPNGYDVEISFETKFHGIDFMYVGDQKSGVRYGSAFPAGEKGLIIRNIHPDDTPTGIVTYQVVYAMYQLQGACEVEWQPLTGAE
jgi:hypothetical protein